MKPEQPSPPSPRQPPPPRTRTRLLGPVPLLVALTLGTWLLPAVWPRLVSLVGFEYPGKWFLDSYAILASGDAVRAGLNPDEPNPLDVLHRPHSYSNWWFALERIGMTRADNFALGASWVAGFLLCAVLVLRVRTYREALLAFAFLASPAVQLAVIRANNDLVVFVLLALAGLCVQRDRNWRLAAAGAAVALATGLKFYPVVAGLFVLLVRPGRRLLAAAGWLGAGVGLVLWNVWPTIGRGDFAIPHDIHKTGVPVLLTDLGVSGRVPQLAAAVLIAVVGYWLARRRYTIGLDSSAADLGERAYFVLGAAVLTGCFVAGTSHAYRWVFSLLLLPWLRRAAVQTGVAAPSRGTARLALVLLGVVVWADGLLCLILNLFWVPQPTTAVDHVEKLWRLGTQPLHWMLVCLLAGWLWDLVWSAGRAVRADAFGSPA